MTTSRKVVSKAGTLLPKANTPMKTKAPITSALAQTKRTSPH